MNRQAEAALARLAAQQHSVFTRSDARPHGLGPDQLARRVRAGTYDQLAPNVFAIAGSQRTWLQSVLTACLARGPGCVASHTTATALHTLDGFPTVAHGPRPIEVQVVRRQRRSRGGRGDDGVITHVTRVLDPDDVTVRFGIPCTTVARTIFDLLAQHDPLDVEHALDAALRDRKVTQSEMRANLARLRTKGRVGATVLEDLLNGDDGEGPGSLLERRFFRLLERAGVTLPVSQLRVPRPGKEPASLDYAYVAERIAIELHGKKGHTTNAERARDAERANELNLLGWHPYQFTYTMLRNTPQTVLAHVLGALRDAHGRAG